MVFSPEGLPHLVAEMGVSQVVFGTDTPFNWPITNEGSGSPATFRAGHCSRGSASPQRRSTSAISTFPSAVAVTWTLT